RVRDFESVGYEIARSAFSARVSQALIPTKTAYLGRPAFRKVKLGTLGRAADMQHQSIIISQAPGSKMSLPAPHFLLYSESRGARNDGEWRFVLQAADGTATFEAADCEPNVLGERLELL